ncbi:hypothetical protein H9P43_001978 [Blastocladiella emersonii ATCC 22665]|nr:hypothetical protein H9P43_001978 [Blastocladiella emersonii ATCC 22665]
MLLSLIDAIHATTSPRLQSLLGALPLPRIVAVESAVTLLRELYEDLALDPAASPADAGLLSAAPPSPSPSPAGSTDDMLLALYATLEARKSATTTAAATPVAA